MPKSLVIPNITYNQRVQLAYDRQSAQRRLDALSPIALKHVIGFARTGNAPTPARITRFLNAQGSFGSLDRDIALIVKWHKDAMIVLKAEANQAV